jgi:hypothetical protein
MRHLLQFPGEEVEAMVGNGGEARVRLVSWLDEVFHLPNIY